MGWSIILFAISSILVVYVSTLWANEWSFKKKRLGIGLVLLTVLLLQGWYVSYLEKEGQAELVGNVHFKLTGHRNSSSLFEDLDSITHYNSFTTAEAAAGRLTKRIINLDSLINSVDRNTQRRDRESALLFKQTYKRHQGFIRLSDSLLEQNLKYAIAGDPEFGISLLKEMYYFIAPGAEGDNHHFLITMGLKNKSARNFNTTIRKCFFSEMWFCPTTSVDYIDTSLRKPGNWTLPFQTAGISKPASWIVIDHYGTFNDEQGKSFVVDEMLVYIIDQKRFVEVKVDDRRMAIRNFVAKGKMWQINKGEAGKSLRLHVSL